VGNPAEGLPENVDLRDDRVSLSLKKSRTNLGSQGKVPKSVPRCTLLRTLDNKTQQLCYRLALRTMSARTPQSHERLLSIFRRADNSLEYLTPNDWMLIVDRAKQVRFKKNESLIREGTPLSMVYLIADGKVKVTASGAELAQLGPGQVCGEMAFLENTVASATATAEADVETYALEWKDLTDVFELFPHLASRFYRSLAVTLSRRLRKQIEGSKGAKAS
jgi:cyclic nucleotide-binding protein